MYTDFNTNRRSLLYKNRSRLLCIHNPTDCVKRKPREEVDWNMHYIENCNLQRKDFGFRREASDALFKYSEGASSFISNLVCWYTKCLQIYTHKFTINGCSILVRIFFSFCTCSTCLSLITSLIFIIFKAWYSPDLRSRQSNTRPKVPVPVCERTTSIL